MEPEGHYRVDTSPYPEPDRSSPYHPSYVSKIHFNTVHPPTPWSFQWSLSFWPSHQYPICIPCFILKRFRKSARIRLYVNFLISFKKILAQRDDFLWNIFQFNIHNLLVTGSYIPNADERPSLNNLERRKLSKLTQAVTLPIYIQKFAAQNLG
jgi:hypothetical protein